MKKLSLLIILLFILSIIPLNSLAEKGSDKDNEEIEIEQESKIELKTSEDDFKKREIEQEFKLKAIEKFKNAEIEFKLKSENSAELKSKIIRLKECKDEDTQECQEFKKNAISYSKEYLINIIDRIIAYLNKLLAKYESSEEISEDTAKLSVEEIKSLLTKLEDLKSRINKATTKEEIISLSNELKTLINNNIKVQSKLYVEKLRISRVGEIIERIEHLKIKLSSILEELKEEGVNTTRVDPLVLKFNNLIDDAKSKYYKAIDLFEKAKDLRETNVEEAKRLVLEAHTNLKEAQQDLKDAHAILVELHQMIKGQRDNAETRCWGDKPSYEPGQELGYFIWQGTCDNTWFLDWSGDLRKKDYRISERIKEEKDFTLERMEKLREEKMKLLKERLGIKERMKLKAEIEVEDEEEIDDDEVTGRITSNISGGFDKSQRDTDEKTIRIKSEIKKANYCSSKDDCEIVGSVCPYGCNIAVNKNEASKIKELLSSYQGFCQYMCVEAKGIDCIEGRCQVLTDLERPIPTENRTPYHVTGTIRTNGKFIDVGPRRFERKDSFKWSDSEISFDAYVSTSFDGLRFRTTGTEVTYNLMIDGKQVKELIYIGKPKKNPAEIPFTLTGKPADKPFCSNNEIMHEGTCQKKIMAEDSKVDTSITTNADGSMQMTMQ